MGEPCCRKGFPQPSPSKNFQTIAAAYDTPFGGTRGIGEAGYFRTPAFVIEESVRHAMKRQRLLQLSIVMLACLTACRSTSAWSGKCVGISDGDTVKVMRQGKPEKIRLFGIDCPEVNQDFGRRAKQFTASMVFGKMVHVETVTRDRYGRTVAWVSVQGASLNRELVRAGLAWWYRRYAASWKDLEQLEQQARNARIGLWSQRNPVPPWEFRREKHR